MFLDEGLYIQKIIWLEHESAGERYVRVFSINIGKWGRSALSAPDEMAVVDCFW
jgi:hypothetical protein